MIQKIKKIKKLDIFQNYTCDSSLPEFKRYNLFYGWNGSGKTTLSKLFDSFNSGENPEYPELEYEIKAEDESIKQGSEYQTKIRVFNKKYIENNIEIINSRAKSIFILGAKNKELSKQIKEDEEKLKKLKKEKGELEDIKISKETEKGKKFTSVAKIIGATYAGGTVRNYIKTHAENDFENLESKQILEDTKVSKYHTILKQEQKQKLSTLEFSFDLDQSYKNVIDICKKTVESKIISRLKEKDDISRWVETGIKLHELHKSDNCEFCDNIISESRLKDLASHFNKADQGLKKEINIEIEELEKKLSELKNIKASDKVLLYKELHTEYSSRLTTFNQEKTNLSLEISTLIKKLEDKKTKTTEGLNFARSLDNNFSDSIVLLNETIEKHNDKTDNFQIQKDEVNLKLKNHYLSEIFDDVKKLEQEAKDCVKQILDIQNGTVEKIGIIDLTKQILNNKATISSEHKACGELNKNLHIFLGREEIIFEVAPAGGYLIKRNDKVAKNLSEGEKTAIAFIYFVVHLKDQDFDLEEGIIVVDDPVSSLDSNSIFQAFSFLKNSVKEAKQVFLLTHNFDFLKLLINWLKHFDHGNNSEYFMIKNSYIDNERIAKIDKIDSLLTKHESEYHYLCKQLFDFREDSEDDKSIQDVYHIPNIGRKVLETFLMFRIPKSGTMYSKIKHLEDNTSFDKNKLTAINKFFNDQSHITGSGFDPSLVQEAEKNVNYLLDMIEKVFPEHYDILKDQFNQN
ncbi:AAA family ATPase [Candidatus Parcubacteria bacterium]|nr:AAA family ATPase [Candidatus Parcubacteria bacterium]